MIEVTDEMETVFNEACEAQQITFNTVAGLEAVLAIVERDHQVLAICREELVPGLRCEKLLIGHRGEHEGTTSTGNTVKWS